MISIVLEFILILLSLTLGIVVFPILFLFQKIFKLPIPNLEKKRLHIHHSSYGLLLVLLGMIISSGDNLVSGLCIAAFGLGFIIHHELSEPGLKGINKFIYINSNLKKK